MAFCELAFSLGVFLLVSVALAQQPTLNPNTPLPGCSLEDGQYGRYLKAHPTYCENFVQCDSAQTRTVMRCPYELLFDEDLGICNYANRVICKQWPCTRELAGQKYPGTCNNVYYQCNGFGYDKFTCPPNTYYNFQAKDCNAVQINDRPECIRFGTVAVDPTINCSLIADPASPCNYKTRVFGVESSPYRCAEGTQFSAGNCTCVASNVCSRSSSSSVNKNPDPDCRASFKVDFMQVVNNVPQVFSEKPTGVDTAIPDYILSSGAEFTGGVATLSATNQQGVQPFIYAYSFANNQLGMNLVLSVVLRASQAQGNFEVLSNNYENACIPTILVTAQYNGNTYTVNMYILGASASSPVGQGTLSANLTNTISASQGEYVEIKVLYDGHATLQLRSKGQNGDTNIGQIVPGTASGFLGARLAYNQCGFRIARGLNGNVRRFVVRESCTSLSRGATL